MPKRTVADAVKCLRYAGVFGHGYAVVESSQHWSASHGFRCCGEFATEQAARQFADEGDGRMVFRRVGLGRWVRVSRRPCLKTRKYGERSPAVSKPTMTTASNPRKFYRTVISVEILSEEPYPPDPELTDVAEDITSGGCSGCVSEIVSNEELSGKDMATCLRAQGRDPGFFGLTDDGEDASV